MSRFKHEYLQHAVAGGVVEQLMRGQSRSSATKARAVLRNPSLEAPEFDLHVPLVALGRVADTLLGLGGRIVQVRGRMSTPDGGGLEIVVEEIFDMSTGDDPFQPPPPRHPT